MNFLGRKWWAGALVCLIALAAGCGGGSSSSALQITTTALPGGNVQNTYSATLGLNGSGTAPYTWSITAGSLPAGLMFGTGTGSIVGLPTTAGTTNLTFMVTDSSSPVETATVSLALLIGNMQITTASLPGGSINVAYNQTLQISDAGDAAGPFTWSISTGALPTNLTLNTTTGAITGTPTVGGIYTFTMEVTDSENPAVSATATYTVSISPLALLNSSLPNGLENTAYSFTLDAVGGTPPYTWSIVAGPGTLPQGLSFNTTTGVISGTPTQTGTYPFVVHVQDSEATPEVATESLQLTIEPSTSSCAGAPTGNESLLSGSYAFLVQGFEGGSSGSPVAIAGSFAANGVNGSGQVTGGDIDVSDITDVNSPGTTPADNHYTVTPYATAPVSLYTVGTDPSGSENVGCVMLTTSVGTTMTFHFSLGSVTAGVASKGKIIEFDDTSGAGIIASGVMSLQDTKAFTGSKLSPNYAFGLDGETPTSQPLAVAGSLAVNSSGAITSAFSDVDIAGTTSSGLTGGTGSFSILPGTDGRSTASITLSSSFSLTATVYIVNASEAYLVSTASPAGGRMFATGNAFPTSLTSKYILYATGIVTCGNNPCADVNLGLLDLTGGGAVSGTLWDYNVSAGESQMPVPGGTYSVGSPSGRVAFTNVGSNGFVGYLVSPVVDGISAVLVGSDAGAHFGFATVQSGTTVPAEPVIYGTLDPRYNSAETYAGTAVISALGALSGSQDSSSQSAKLESGSTVSRSVSLVNGIGSAPSGGGLNITITDGSRLFWFDYGGAPAVITVAEPQ